MDRFEKLVLKIMKECEADGEPVTREEAEEMARMEIGAKDVSMDAHAAAPTLEKDKRKRTVKVSDEKAQIFTSIKAFLSENYENVEVLKENKLIEVKIGEKTFKIDLIEGRKPKK